jgi:hypothetical protein
MPFPSPVTPIPAEKRDERWAFPQHESQTLVPPPLIAAGAELASTPQDSRAALLLTAAAIVYGVDALVRPLVDPSTISHPIVHSVVGGLLLGTAVGLWRRWRPARTIARALGYGLGVGLFTTLDRLPDPSVLADWWVVVVFTAQGAALGFMMNVIGWVGEREHTKKP